MALVLLSSAWEDLEEVCGRVLAARNKEIGQVLEAFPESVS